MLCIFLCVAVHVRGQLAGVDFLHPEYKSLGLNSGHHGWQQMPLFSEPSHHLQYNFLIYGDLESETRKASAIDVFIVCIDNYVKTVFAAISMESEGKYPS